MLHTIAVCGIGWIVAEKWKSKAFTSALQRSDTLKAAKNIFGERYLNHILSSSADCGKLGA